MRGRFFCSWKLHGRLKKAKAVQFWNRSTQAMILKEWGEALHQEKQQHLANLSFQQDSLKMTAFRGWFLEARIARKEVWYDFYTLPCLQLQNSYHVS